MASVFSDLIHFMGYRSAEKKITPSVLPLDAQKTDKCCRHQQMSADDSTANSKPIFEKEEEDETGTAKKKRVVKRMTFTSGIVYSMLNFRKL